MTSLPNPFGINSSRQQSVQSESSVDLVAPLYLTAAANGDAETLRKLIAENTAVNASDKIGATPLMYAARNNQIECMKILLEAGADRSLQTKKGYTALWFAENNHHEDAASLLRVETIA